MNNSRLNRTYTLQECSRNMNTSDVTISKSEDSEETVNYSLVYDVCKSKDTSGCQTHSKLLHKSENDLEVFAPQSEIMKTVQSLTLTEPELLKQGNDNGTNDSQDDDGTDDNKDGDGTDDNKVDYGTYKNQAYAGKDDVHEDICNKQDEANMFYGTHETQVSEGGEADLHKHLVGCKKNPGHTKFVPVYEFNINHLPQGHHDNDLVETIKAVSDLTVRVAVKMTSPERPAFRPNTTVPYAFYNMSGSHVMRVGTGMLSEVNIVDDEGTCRCHKCQHSNTPSKVWGDVIMYTATHVVFDDLEARHTTCRLFFDRQDSPMVTLNDWTVRKADIEEDRCELKCVTCDVDLLFKLFKMEGHRWDLWDKLKYKYWLSRGKVKLTFIVSHPHGCAKQISVGQWIDKYVVNGGDHSDIDIFCSTKYTYTTCTCPGSSGAQVHPLGYDDWLYNNHIHSGVNSKGNNYSTNGLEFCKHR